MSIDSLAHLLKLLGDANRLVILFFLEDEPRSVSQIMEITRLSQPLVSFHLKVLREAGLVKTERKGTFVFNALCDPDLPKFIRQFRKYTVEGSKESENGFKFPWDCCSMWMKRSD